MSGFTCPGCGYHFYECEDIKDHVTYWGEDPPVDDECPRCELAITVEEHVDRSWTVTPTKGESQ